MTKPAASSSASWSRWPVPDRRGRAWRPSAHRAGSQAGPPGTTRPDAPLHRRPGRGAGSDAGRRPRGSDAHAAPHQRRRTSTSTSTTDRGRSGSSSVRRRASRPTRSCSDRSWRWLACSARRRPANCRTADIGSGRADPRTCGSWRRPPGPRRAAVAPAAVREGSPPDRAPDRVAEPASGNQARRPRPRSRQSSRACRVWRRRRRRRPSPRRSRRHPSRHRSSARGRATTPARLRRRRRCSAWRPSCSAGAAWRSDRPAWRDAWWPTSASASDGTAIVEGSELPGPAGGIGASPRLVPLTVVEDAHERAGRILPPT